MITDENFILTVAKGSVLHRTTGSVILNSIPEDAFSMWKEGEYFLILKKSGAPLLEGLSKEELEVILEKRKPINNLPELKLIESAIKALVNKNKPKNTENKNG